MSGVKQQADGKAYGHPRYVVHRDGVVVFELITDIGDRATPAQEAADR